jgi:hypothetical protein
LSSLAEDAIVISPTNFALVDDSCASPDALAVQLTVICGIGVAAFAFVSVRQPVWYTSAVYASRIIPITDFTEIIRFVPTPHAGAVLLAPSGEHDDWCTGVEVGC